MRFKLYIISAVLLVTVTAKSQVHDSRIQIDTMVKPAVQFESSYSNDDASNAIEAYFDSMHIEKEKGKGFIIKKSMGYMLFRRAKAEYINDVYDFYFVVETRKQKGRDASTVYVALANNGSFISPENNKLVWNQLTDFAAYLQSNYFDQYKANAALADLTKDLDKQRKKLDDVLKQKSQLESNIANDSTQIVNLNDQLLKLKAKKQ